MTSIQISKGGYMPAGEHILHQISNSDAHKVKLAITDIDGILRGKYVHKDKFLAAAENGFGFCNVVFGWDCNDTCYDQADYTGWHTGYPDAEAYIDLSTHRNIPYDQNVDFFLGDFSSPSGEHLAVCPRSLLKAIRKQAEELGYHASFGFEFEWFNFRESPDSLNQKDFQQPQAITPGMFGYSLLRAGQNRGFINQIIDDLQAMRVPLEGIHTETGPGVYEAAILKDDVLEAADRAVLFKSAVKEIAQTHGIIASFMARWNASLPGCSGHMHQSLSSSKTGEAVFYNKNQEHGLSQIFQHYLAGLLHCLPEILPMLAPTVNSYKRLVEGFWAPTTATWGVDNRTAALRVIPGSKTSTRVEVRLGGSDLNPYLGAAACLAAGLYGIRNKLALSQEPIRGNAYEAKNCRRFAKNLYEASAIMSQSKLANELFGDTFVKHFCDTRFWEWQQYQQAVSDWELRRYFEII